MISRLKTPRKSSPELSEMLEEGAEGSEGDGAMVPSSQRPPRSSAELQEQVTQETNISYEHELT